MGVRIDQNMSPMLVAYPVPCMAQDLSFERNLPPGLVIVPLGSQQCSQDLQPVLQVAWQSYQYRVAYASGSKTTFIDANGDKVELYPRL
eukprot:m.48106 g.48106  ORF g.48106 m.48106 type:complete len:89 (-) comp13267_c0_seq1:326-592(-)